MMRHFRFPSQPPNFVFRRATVLNLKSPPWTFFLLSTPVVHGRTKKDQRLHTHTHTVCESVCVCVSGYRTGKISNTFLLEIKSQFCDISQPVCTSKIQPCHLKMNEPTSLFKFRLKIASSLIFINFHTINQIDTANHAMLELLAEELH